MKSNIIDCITFFQENFQVELRFNILNDVVNKFVVCESLYDHRGREKKINFDSNNFPEFKNKIIHLIKDKPFPKKNIPWKNQALQREYLFNGIKEDSDEDLIMFSDPDEIPNPKILKNLVLSKKYGIFMQKMYTYKLNLLNQFESPWQGTRICKKKNLKSIDWLRQKVVAKNLNYPFWRMDKEKSIQLIENGGWHFNYLLKPEKISKKLQSLAETKWDFGEGLTREQFYSIHNIENKIYNKKDLFNRGHVYKTSFIDETFPDFIVKNVNRYNEWVI